MTVDDRDVPRERCELITRLLRDDGELGPGESIIEIAQLEGGWSRFSHIARARLSDGGERRYVVRVKAPKALFDTDLVVEYNIFVGLENVDLPTPRAFGLHEDENPFGGELFVMDYLTGRSYNTWRRQDNAELKADWEGSRGIAADSVEYLARIHAIGPDDAPDGLPKVEFPDQVERWRRAYADAALVRDPVMEEAFHWLAGRPPPDRRTGLVHGDYRIGNMLIEDGRLNAILDWELAYLGDTRFDLGYIALDYIAGKHLRPKTDLLGGIAEMGWFFSEYERLSGAPVDREVVRTYSVLGAVSLMAMAHTGARRYVEGANIDMRRAWASYGMPGLRQDLARLMRW